jgi:hypothetical protein
LRKVAIWQLEANGETLDSDNEARRFLDKVVAKTWDRDKLAVDA